MNKDAKPNEVIAERLRLINHLSALTIGTDEYDKVLEELKKFGEIEMQIKALRPESRLDKILNNAPLVGSAATIFISVLMLNFEKTDVITSSVGRLVRSRI